MTDSVSIYMPSYDPYDGYGRMGLELIYRLSKMEINVNPMGVAGGKILYETQTEAMQELLNKPVAAGMGGIMFGYPTLYPEYGEMAAAGPRIAVTMFESTRLPDGWVRELNKCNAVIVPSKWLVDAFKKCGVVKPIHVVPLGVSETFKPIRQLRTEKSADDPYTFLTIGDRGMRKGWDIAALAFSMAFDERDDVKLIVKTRKDGFPYHFKNRNIEVVQGDFSEFELNELYNNVDCMVFPSRGEGFGLPPREFAATGGAAIVTKWWADDVTSWGYPVDYQMSKAWQQHRQFKELELGKWAEADVNSVAKQMLYLADTQGLSVREWALERNAQQVRKLYSWQKFSERVWEIWQDVVAPKEKRWKGSRRVSISE